MRSLLVRRRIFETLRIETFVKRQEHMATTETVKEKAARGTFFDFGGYDFKGFEAATQTWKDLVGQQLRATQTITEQTMVLSKKAADYWAAQTTEAMKLQQEALKFTFGMADDVRKQAFETAERAMK